MLNDYLYQRIFLELTGTRENSGSGHRGAAIGATTIGGGMDAPSPFVFDSTIFDFSRRGRLEISLLTPKRLVNVDEFEKRGGRRRNAAPGMRIEFVNDTNE